MSKVVGRPLHIAIGVHGRFYAFDVAKALQQAGQEVSILTNYPAFAVHKFGVKQIKIHSFSLHGIVTRGLGKVINGALLKTLEPHLHQLFGRWLSYQTRSNQYDVLNVYSGVAEETLMLRKSGALKTVCLLERASAHISIQNKLLQSETNRTSTSIDAPSQWMLAREGREYLLADHINVPSTFAQQSFVEEKFPPEKITITPLGVNTSDFRASSSSITKRIERILANEPLRILYVGQVGFRKGLWDLRTIIQKVDQERFHFTLVGAVTNEASPFMTTLLETVRVAGHQPQATLPQWYSEADLFLFPTIEDGFAVVLAQAQAAGLPIIATTNCSAPDFLEEGKSGWIVPIRAPDQIVEQLQWCDTHRAALAEMVAYTHRHPYVRDWRDVGQDYLTLMQRLVAQR